MFFQPKAGCFVFPLLFRQFKSYVRAEPAFFAGADGVGVVCIEEMGEGFHAYAVARGIGCGQAVFVECDFAVKAVLDENIQHVVLADGDDGQGALALRLFLTGMNGIFDEVGKDHG